MMKQGMEVLILTILLHLLFLSKSAAGAISIVNKFHKSILSLNNSVSGKLIPATEKDECYGPEKDIATVIKTNLEHLSEVKQN